MNSAIPGDRQCVFDFVATGNKELAQTTQRSNAVVKANSEVLGKFSCATVVEITNK